MVVFHTSRRHCPMPSPACTGTDRHRAKGCALARLRMVLLTLGCAAACPAADAAEGIFLATDEHEIIHLSDQATGLAPILLVSLSAAAGASLSPGTGTATQSERRVGRSRRGDPAIDAVIDGAAKQHRVSAELIRAVIATESAFDVRALSPRGAMGLMQLMPATARELGVTDAFDARQNIDAGTRHLRLLLDRFGDDTLLALAAYNAGAGAVESHGLRIPPFVETLAYVPRVLRHLNAFSAATPPNASTPMP